MQERLTVTLQKNFTEGHRRALAEDNLSLEPVHVVEAMANDSSSALASMCQTAKVEIAGLRTGLNRLIAAMPKTSSNSGELASSKDLIRTINLSEKITGKSGDSHIGADTYLLACVEKIDSIKEIFTKFGFPLDKLKEAHEVYRGNSKISSNRDEELRNALETYTDDLTAAAEADKLDPVIGRDEEIRRTMQILQRRRKNNPVLIGEPGVGKTAIAEGLAQRIVAGEVPEHLKGRRLLVLDLPGMLAGAKYRGEFEERLKEVLKQISEDDKYILFIDEMHTLIGAGKAEGAVDAANMLKPALARGELRCIGATTLDEYRKYIEKDAAFERRFQRLLVEEPDEAATIAILRGLRERYEVHHGVRITDSAIIAAAELSARYVTDRKLPDKAIDLIDEAAAWLRIEADSKPEALELLDRRQAQLSIEHASLKRETDNASKQRLKDIEVELKKCEKEREQLEKRWDEEKVERMELTKIKEELESLRAESERLKKVGNFEKVAEIEHGRIPDLTKQVAMLSNRKSERMLKTEIGEQEIATVVAKSTGIPVARLLGSERTRLLGMEDHLCSRVLNQDQAISAISSAVMRSRTGISDPNRPTGTFLFLGPTGVGKTELAKAVSEFLLDSERHLVRIDMSEYSEKHSVARLIGAPPGYVGYEEGGQLTELVRRKPYCVVLLDELEKAHPEVFNIFLQLLDEGRLTDGQGRVVDFRNVVLIMTSNLGSAELRGKVSDKARASVLAEVNEYFKPEFLNRLDEIIVFNGLDQATIKQIARLQLDLLVTRLRKQKYVIDYQDSVVDLLSKVGFDQRFGARPLARAIQKLVETPLAEAILAGKWQEGKTINIQVVNDEIKFNFSSKN